MFYIICLVIGFVLGALVMLSLSEQLEYKERQRLKDLTKRYIDQQNELYAVKKRMAYYVETTINSRAAE